MDSYQTCWPLDTVKQSTIKQIHELTNNQIHEYLINNTKIKNWNIIQNVELLIILKRPLYIYILILFTNEKKECNIVAIFQRKDNSIQDSIRIIFLIVEYTWDCTFRWRECNADEQRDAVQFGRLIFLTLIERIRECMWSYYWKYKDTGSCLQCLLDKTAT